MSAWLRVKVRSGDSSFSVFQIAAHEDVVPIDELYRICEIARDILDPFNVARVIARPFVGATPDDYKRTYNRRDYAVPPPEPTVLDTLKAAGKPVVGVGKGECGGAAVAGPYEVIRGGISSLQLVAGSVESGSEAFSAALELAAELQEHVSSSQAARIAAE